MSEIALDYDVLPRSSEKRNRRPLPDHVRRWVEAAKNSLFQKETTDTNALKNRVNGALTAAGKFIAPMATEYYQYLKLTGRTGREKRPLEQIGSMGKIAAAAGIDLLSLGASLIPTSGIPKLISELPTMAPYLVGGISAVKGSIQRRFQR